jgi:flavin-dependent dehydrogenase
MRIAILGAGPAAGAAALRLARGGLAPTLFHPARRGEKPCGGALPSFLLDEIEGFDAASLVACTVRRAVLENASGASLELELEGLRIYRRGDLDPALVEAAGRAGAEIRPQRVRELAWVDGRVELRSEGGDERFDWVVAADGARGLSRRRLGLEPRGDSLGLGASLPGIEVASLTLSFPELSDAYLWIFPRPGGCSVGIAHSADRVSAGAARDCLESFLERHLGVGLGSVPGASRYRYPIPVWGPWSLAAVERGLARRLLLVGDAAALADPLTREGIRHAVRSGRWAAEALLAGSPESYVARLAAGMEADLTRAARARDLFYDARIGQWMVPVCRRHPGVRRVLADLLACRQGYVGLKRRLLGSALGLDAEVRRRESQAP